MAEITSDAVLGFAKQGHPQAIAVLLNRALVPKGAHVKVRQKKGLLKVLINFLRENELEHLVNRVQDTIHELAPEQIKRVQIFTQRLGDKQAAFQREVLTESDSATRQNHPAVRQLPQTTKPAFERHAARPPKSQPSSNNGPIKSAKSGVTKTPPSATGQLPSQSADGTTVSQSRYSVAEFLSQVSNVEELNVLEDHPFFTGVCPRCSQSYADLESPPLFWDCQTCGWKDDLSQKVPSHLLKETPQRRKIRQGKRLGSYLVEAGLLTPAQIQVALADQQLAGVRLGEVLVRRGWIKEETVEYFMRKVVEPERQASTGQAEAYMESSRNLLKTLIQNHAESQGIGIPSSSTTDSSAVTAQNEDALPITQPPQVNQINSKETLILSDLDMPAVSPENPANAVNERETLLLPDIEFHRMLGEQDSE
ncbi:MAG: hypothetical protein AAGB01_06385 [Cyanobacteria bacterium P01_F01_bin.42]